MVKLPEGKYIMYISLNSTFGVKTNLGLQTNDLELLMCICDLNIPIFCDEFKFNETLHIKIGIFYLISGNTNLYDYITIKPTTKFILVYRSKYNYTKSYTNRYYFPTWFNYNHILKDFNHTILVKGILSFIKLDDDVKSFIYKLPEIESHTPTEAIGI